MAKEFVPQELPAVEREREPIEIVWHPSVIQAAWLLKHTLALLWALAIVYVLINGVSFLVGGR